jgi:hypothetical protein
MDWRPRLVSLRQLLILTTKEKQVLIFVMVAFLLGVVVKHYRETHRTSATTIKETTAAETRHASHSATKQKAKTSRRSKPSPPSMSAAPAND